jgi:hypothetical protein
MVLSVAAYAGGGGGHGGGGGFHGDGGGPRTRHSDSDHSRAVDELLSQEREHHKSELIGLELAIAKLEDAVSALELALVTERGRVLDLANPLKRVN